MYWLGVQFDAQGSCDLEDGRKTGIAVPRQRFVKTFPTETRIARKLRHTLGLGYGTQGLGNESCIVSSLLQARLQVKGHILFGFEMFCTIPFPQLKNSHLLPLQLTRQRLRRCNVCNRFVVSEMALLYPIDTSLDSTRSVFVFQGVKPPVKNFGRVDRLHGRLYQMGYK
jgi:hypothetical protein